MKKFLKNFVLLVIFLSFIFQTNVSAKTYKNGELATNKFDISDNNTHFYIIRTKDIIRILEQTYNINNIFEIILKKLFQKFKTIYNFNKSFYDYINIDSRILEIMNKALIDEAENILTEIAGNKHSFLYTLNIIKHF